MALKLFAGNRLEHLAAIFREQVFNDPSKDIFVPETVVVQTRGMELYLRKFLASDGGIAANLQTPFLNRFFTLTMRAFLPPEEFEKFKNASEQYSPEILKWHIYSELSGDPERYPAAAGYTGSADLCYQLSSRLAEIFDRYIWYHADLLCQWRSDSAEKNHWERLLYRRLTEKIGESPDRFVERFLSAPRLHCPEALPQRLSFFGIGTMPPLMFSCLKAFAGHADVYLFYLNPCCEYWGEMRSDFLLRREAREKDLPEPEIQEDNPLLANLGTWGRDFFENTIDLQNGGLGEDSFIEVLEGKEEPTMLDHLQNNILHSVNLTGSDQTACGGDRSISIHNCHSKRREVEILHDQILKSLEDFADEGIRPDDIIVMAPNINTYAPYIETVFSSGRLQNSYSICDRSLTAVSSTADNLLRILSLHSKRGTAAEIVEIIDNPAVRENFDFDETAVRDIIQMISDASIRWGEDADTRQEFTGVGFEEFSWMEGLNRLLLGCIAREEGGAVNTPWTPVVPKGGSELLGDFVCFVRNLFRWRRELRQEKTPAEWLVLLEEIVSTMYGRAYSFRDETAKIRSFILNWGRVCRKSGFEGRIPLSVVKKELDGITENAAGGQGFLSRGITFCSLVPMRSIPAKIIAVLGMTAVDFPRQDAVSGLNVSQAVRGERSRLLEDRYLFLETILSARKRLMFFYPGQNASEKTQISPSAPLTDLLNYLKQEFAFKETLHLRHACSPAYFREEKTDPNLFSYSGHSRAVAEILRGEQKKNTEEIANLPEQKTVTVQYSLEDLASILVNAPRHYMKRTVGIDTYINSSSFQEEELFSAEPTREDIRNIIGQGMAGEEEIKTSFIRNRQLPLGAPGETAFKSVFQQYADVLKSEDALRSELLASAKEYLCRDFTLDDGTVVRVDGFLRRGPGGKMFYFSLKDDAQSRVQVYLSHLFNASCGCTAGSWAYLDGKNIFSRDCAEQGYAEKCFKELLEIAREAEVRPLPLFWNSSCEYGKSRNILKAEELFLGNQFASGDYSGCKDFFPADSFRDEKFLEEFTRLAHIVYAPWYRPPANRNGGSRQSSSTSIALQNREQNSLEEFDSLSVALGNTVLVEAAAGTGKTYNIQNLVVRLLLEEDLAIENIAVATYTEPAADELRSRLRSVINNTAAAVKNKDFTTDPQAGKLAGKALDSHMSEEDILKKLYRANLDFDKAVIGTLHSFCFRLLKDYAFECGEHFSLELLPESSDLLDSFAADTFRKYCYRGEKAVMWSSLLSLKDLKKFVSQKEKRPELVFFPPADAGDIKMLSDRYMELWQEFQQVDIWQFSAPFESLMNKSSLKSITEKLLECQKDVFFSSAASSLWEKVTADNFCSKANKGNEDACRAICSTAENIKLFGMFAEILQTRVQLQRLFRDKAVEETISRFEEFKKKEKLLTYDDMLRRTQAALQNKGFLEAVRGRLKAGIVDEFQDTDPCQWEICQQIFADRTLFLVGDPRQAIYSFRGGDIFTYLAARSSVPPERCYTLSVNYRSCQKLLDEINHWFCDHPCGFAIPDIVLPRVTAPEGEDSRVMSLLIDGKETEKPFSIIRCGNMTPEETAAEKIRQLLTARNIRIPATRKKEEHAIAPDDIAVLVRDWKEADNVRWALAERNIPCAMQKTTNVFHGAVAEHFQRVLCGIWNVNKLSAVKAALLTPLCGMRISELLPEGGDQEAVFEKIRNFGELKNLWETRSFYVMFRKFLRMFDVETRYVARQNGLRELTDLIQIGDILHQEASLRKLSPRALIDYLIQCRDTSDQKFLSEQEADSGAVVICTEYSSKGLQYPVVILPALHRSSKIAEVYHQGNTLLFDTEKNNSPNALLEPLQEELRLAYVALTRAEHACTVIVPQEDCKLYSAVGWLWRNRGGDDSFVLPAGYGEELPKELPAYQPDEDTALLRELEFTASLRKPRYTTSYTKLKPEEHGKPSASLFDDDNEKEDDNGEDRRETEEKKNNPYKRLRGKNFGLMLHSIMEYIDFAAGEEVIADMVRREIIVSEPKPEELDYSASLVRNTLACQLQEGVFLRDIPREKRLSELVFHLGFSGSFASTDLHELADEHLKVTRSASRGKDFDGGCITGSIDLVFEHGGKYHIIDWKSNELAGYSHGELRKSIAENYYHLQYLIYLAALLRFLKQRGLIGEISAETYKKYIGGIHYVYMRGVDPADPSAGVYSVLPDYDCVEKILEVLK